MINTFKWIYKLGHDKARNDIIKELEALYGFHTHQQQISLMKELQHERVNVSAESHQASAETIYNLLGMIDPDNHPDLSRYMEMKL